MVRRRKSFYGDSVQDVVDGLGPDERVLAVAENAGQAVLNGQPTAVPKNADGAVEDDPPDQNMAQDVAVKAGT